MNINLHIERLVLDGLPIEASQRRVVQAAVEAELSRLLTVGGISASLQSGGAMPSLRADALQLNADSNPRQIGNQIAQSIYGGIGK